MGGGDLNLKKSWHPQTIRNVEKVWKAEQKAEAEAKKIEQLQKELKEERAREEMQRHAVQQGIARKKGERLDWMYSTLGGQVDHELYLLGKPVDKAVDPMAQDNDEDSSAPGASFMNDTGANSANDLAAKIRDDPLFLIKKKEEEKRKELLKNPVKMKQLKLMLQANLEKSVKKKKKDKKKKSKQEKKEKRRERHRGSSKESVDEVRETMKENKRRRQLEQDKELYNGSHRNHYRQSHRSSEKRRHRHRSRSRSPVSRGHREETGEDRRRRRNSSSSPEKEKRRRSLSPSSSPPRKAAKSPPSRRGKSWKDRGSAVTKGMDASEKEKRLAAMMENAKWRDEQRGRNLKRYREEDAKLEAKDAIDAEKSAEFLVDMKLQSFSSKSTSSVSDRIRRNINSVQRTPAALESFLAK